MAKKTVYKPVEGAFNLDEKKSLNPYGSKDDKKKSKQKPKKSKK